MICPKCGSEHVSITTYSEEKKTGCLTILLYIILALMIIGIPIVIIMILLRKKTQSGTMCICQDCGYNWKI